MSGIKPATAAEFFGFMKEGAATYTSGWDTAGQWHARACLLAQFLADHAGRFPARDAVPLFEIGSLMLLLEEREREAEAIAAGYLRGFLTNGGKGGAQ